MSKIFESLYLLTFLVKNLQIFPFPRNILHHGEYVILQNMVKQIKAARFSGNTKPAGPVLNFLLELIPPPDSIEMHDLKQVIFTDSVIIICIIEIKC